MKFNITVTGTLLLAFLITIMAFVLELISYNSIKISAGVFLTSIAVSAALAGGRKYLDTKFSSKKEGE